MSIKFDVEDFCKRLQTSWLGSEFIYLEKTNSTNSYLKNIPSEKLVHGTVVLADHQTKGRGQYEREWEADPYKNLTFTIALRPKASDRLNLLSLAAAYSVTRTLSDYISKPVSLKWPNDIIVDGKKIGGELTECTFNGSNPDRVLIGLGLNIGQKNFSNGLKDSAISLKQIADKPFSREHLLNEILLGIEDVYTRWHRRDEKLQQDISQKLLGYGKWVQISINGIIPNQEFKLIGINTNGELLMLNEQLDVNKFTHEQVRILSGHTRVQKSETGQSF